jgi:hypothetical protein
LIVSLRALAGQPLTVEFIDPDEARAAAAASMAANSVPSRNHVSVMPASAGTGASAGSDDAPALLIHAARSGERFVMPAGASSSQPATAVGSGQVLHINAIFKSTQALPKIYYQENERSVAKRARVGDVGKGQ